MKNKGRPVGTKKKGVKYLNRDEWERFLKATERSVMANFLFSLMFKVAGRVGEIANIKLSDIDEERKAVVIRALKGGWTEKYSLNSELWKKYRRWMKKRKKLIPAKRGNPYLFITKLSRPDKPISRDNIQLLFKIFAKEANLDEGFSCHSLRHTMGVRLAEANMSVPKIQAYLRQKSPSSALLYIQLAGKERVEVIKECEGFADNFIF